MEEQPERCDVEVVTIQRVELQQQQHSHQHMPYVNCCLSVVDWDLHAGASNQMATVSCPMHMTGAGYFLGAACLAFNFYFALGVLLVLIGLAMPWAIVGEPQP